MEKKCEVLVIEDNPEFIRVAKSIFNNEPISVIYASTYEEALEALRELKEKGSSFGVLTDLFFPSEINFVEHLFPKIKKGIEETKAKFRETLKQLEGHTSALWFREKIAGLDEVLWEFEHLDENPSGLAIIDYCLENKVPILVLSQGNRHCGNLGIVRNAWAGSDILGASVGLIDFLFRRDGADKKDPVVWRDAMREMRELLAK